MIEKNKTYNAADFERYHNGSMPANEMHALEKAALEDPFLADALEGYAYSTSATGDINELRLRLPEKKKNKNVIPLFSFKANGWWRIAALLAVIAGASYFFYQVNYRNADNNNTLAINPVQDSTHQKDSSASVFSDTSPGNNIALEKTPRTKPFQKEVILPAKKTAREQETFSADANKEPSAPVASTSVLSDKLYADSSNNAMAKKKNEHYKQENNEYFLRGKVTDEQGKPLAFATIKDKSRNKATVSDTAGNFSLYSNDSAVTAMVSVLGYNSKEIRLGKNEEPTIAVNKSNEALSEVVVTGYGTQKKEKLTQASAAPKQLNGKADGLEISPIISVNKEFDKYLQKNTTPLYDENNLRITGEVILSFTVNSEGKPKNIKVIKSTCKACEGEAVKLLKNGPHWDAEKNTNQNTLIKF